MGCQNSSGVGANAEEPAQYSWAQAENPLKELVGARKWEVDDLQQTVVVGEGMFSRVWIAKIKNPPDQMPVALKILKKKDIVKMQQVEHVRQEKDLLLRITHPFIVQLLGAFQDERCLYMMMEFVNGGELHEYIQVQAGATDIQDCRFFSSEIFLALAYLHALDIAHRDLKPQNVLLDDQGHVKLTDFGFAKSLRKEEKAYTLVGTPEYVAPEIIKKEGHAHAVDWWAYGILVFEILMGFTPFCGDNMDAIFENVLHGDVNCPKHMDAQARDLVLKLLVQDPAKRLGSHRSGSRGIQKHSFFKGSDWVALRSRAAKSPHVPAVSGPEDTSMFVKYDNKRASDEGPEHVSEEEQKLFMRFSTHEEEHGAPHNDLKDRMLPKPRMSLQTNDPEVAEAKF